MSAISRQHGKRRAFFYACLAHYKRGAAVCPNGRSVRMEHVDRAVLEALADDVLSPAVILAVVDGVFDAMKAPTRSAHLDRHRAELKDVDQQITRLTDGIAAGGRLPSLLARLTVAQARRDELDALVKAHAVIVAVALNRKAVERTVRQRLQDWRGLLTANVQDGRELLRRTLAGPLRFTAEESGYRFDGEAAIGRVLEGVIGVPLFGTSPAGTSPFHLAGTARRRAA